MGEGVGGQKVYNWAGFGGRRPAGWRESALRAGYGVRLPGLKVTVYTLSDIGKRKSLTFWVISANNASLRGFFASI